MSETIALVANGHRIRRYVEIGSYEGGSILALALRFANRDIDFYSVESFMGNCDGTMDGHRLPSRRAFLDNIRRYPALRVTHVPGDSRTAAKLFGDRTIDFVFIDACHHTPALLEDIDAWMPKLSDHGIMAGDDYSWRSVQDAVKARHARVNVTPSGSVWWMKQEDSLKVSLSGVANAA